MITDRIGLHSVLLPLQTTPTKLGKIQVLFSETKHLKRSAVKSQRKKLLGFVLNVFPFFSICQQVAGLLLSHQAKVNVKDYKGNTPLHLCCFSGNLDPANVLLLVQPKLSLLVLKSCMYVSTITNK